MLRSDTVLEFWLGPEAGRDQPSDNISARWWKKDPAFDAEIVAGFGGAIAAAGRGELEGWAVAPRGRLAIVILLDQMTRNAYRDSARMYDNDAIAVAHALAAIDAGDDQRLKFAERYFLYMPLMHSEDLVLQDRCCALFEQLGKEAPHLANSVTYAHAHRDIVARFSRFPHRNVLLGRPSSAEEEVFLSQPGSSF